MLVLGTSRRPVILRVTRWCRFNGAVLRLGGRVKRWAMPSSVIIGIVLVIVVVVVIILTFITRRRDMVVYINIVFVATAKRGRSAR